jgi:dihydropteroate synthase
MFSCRVAPLSSPTNYPSAHGGQSGATIVDMHQVMGIVNVTPDSFSDGGSFLEPRAAIAHGYRLVSEGATILDVGGESTRPGAVPVDEATELRRVLPVLEGLADTGAQLSIDTFKPAVARAALERGVTLINDVTGLRGGVEVAQLAAEHGAELCIMHSIGDPRTMQDDPRYEDVVTEVVAFLKRQLELAMSCGVPRERVLLDPGIGFGKRLPHNLQLLNRLEEIVAIGCRVLIGTSRKAFLGTIAGRDAQERLGGTVATNVLALASGASVFRVHDVAPVADALAVAAATLAGTWPTTS